MTETDLSESWLCEKEISETKKNKPIGDVLPCRPLRHTTSLVMCSNDKWTVFPFTLEINVEWIFLSFLCIWWLQLDEMSEALGLSELVIVNSESHLSCSDIIHSFDSLPVVMAVCNAKSGWPFHAFITVQQLW